MHVSVCYLADVCMSVNHGGFHVSESLKGFDFSLCLVFPVLFLLKSYASSLFALFLSSNACGQLICAHVGNVYYLLLNPEVGWVQIHVPQISGYSQQLVSLA